MISTLTTAILEEAVAPVLGIKKLKHEPKEYTSEIGDLVVNHTMIDHSNWW